MVKREGRNGGFDDLSAWVGPFRISKSSPTAVDASYCILDVGNQPGLDIQEAHVSRQRRSSGH